MLEVDIVKKIWQYNLQVSFKLNNQVLVLWAPSGAGKTTILHCLAGLLTPNSGMIKLDNQILYSSRDRINVPTRHREIGYLFQDYALFPHLTVEQNVLYGIKNNKNKRDNYDKVFALLASFGVELLVNRYPHQLSGGEKQRIALVRALSVQPRLLLLDEPLSAVDKENRLALRKELKKIHHQWRIPFIIVTHDVEEANFLGDIIYSLRNGTISEVAALKSD